MKIPILASSYHSGNGLESRLSQSGVYFELRKLFDSETITLKDSPTVNMMANVAENVVILSFVLYLLVFYAMQCMVFHDIIEHSIELH